MNDILKIIGIVILILALLFLLGLYGLGWFKFFAPKTENIRREVFENTQSYTHGKIQDLAKYCEEYNKSNSTGREAIKQLILFRFAEFDARKINSEQLKQFLVQTRGY